MLYIRIMSRKRITLWSIAHASGDKWETEMRLNQGKGELRYRIRNPEKSRVPGPRRTSLRDNGEPKQYSMLRDAMGRDFFDHATPVNSRKRPLASKGNSNSPTMGPSTWGRFLSEFIHIFGIRRVQFIEDIINIQFIVCH